MWQHKKCINLEHATPCIPTTFAWTMYVFLVYPIWSGLILKKNLATLFDFQARDFKRKPQPLGVDRELIRQYLMHQLDDPILGGQSTFIDKKYAQSFGLEDYRIDLRIRQKKWKKRRDEISYSKRMLRNWIVEIASGNNFTLWFL